MAGVFPISVSYTTEKDALINETIRRAGVTAVKPLGMVLAIAAMSLLAACAQPARVTQMTVPNILAQVVAANLDLQESISVGEVSGGQATNPLWTSQVNNPEFREALEQSLEFNGVLARKSTPARFVLAVQLHELKQPLMGLDLTVTPRVTYRVTDQAGATEIYAEELTTPYTAPFSSSLIAIERLRIANEGAIRESISKFLSRLGEVWTERKARGEQPTPAQPAARGKPVS